MTSRERWLAAVRLKPIDRLPFWPKLNASYAPAQAEPFRGMTLDAIHEWIGSDPHVGLGAALKETRTRTTIEQTSAGGTTRIVYRSPAGMVELVRAYDTASASWHPLRFPVTSVEQVRILTEVFDDVSIELDRDALDKAKVRAREIGERAVTAATIGTSPLMQWLEWQAGLEMGQYLLADCPSEVEALLEAQHRVLLRKTELLAETHPADLLYLNENTSTTLLSPAQFRRHCTARLREYGSVTRALNRPLALHMCGHLKALLPDLAPLPVEVFEAFTSPTVGNTTLLDGRTACPDKCLIGGTNAMLWIRPAGEIIRQIRQDLDCLPHHRGIVVTSAGVMPPRCTPETIREVRRDIGNYVVKG